MIGSDVISRPAGDFAGRLVRLVGAVTALVLIWVGLDIIRDPLGP